jgi:hypothetical protein
MIEAAAVTAARASSARTPPQPHPPRRRHRNQGRCGMTTTQTRARRTPPRT